jgi:hypothetical protein
MLNPVASYGKKSGAIFPALTFQIRLEQIPNGGKIYV